MAGTPAAAAFSNADALTSSRASGPRPKAPTQPARTVAIGDPQTSAAHFFAILEHHQLLGPDGFLRPEVQLVSMGDHFDYDANGKPVKAAAPREPHLDGIRILSWLAVHDPAQVVIVLGNHDACRVMELSAVTDDMFEAARGLAAELDGLGRQREEMSRRLASEWRPRFPDLPAPGLVHRDYCSFTVRQRRLVASLLLDGRYALAATAMFRGRTALLTHAGVTEREVDKLRTASEPFALAGALNRALDASVNEVRADWNRDRFSSLSFGDLHVPGAKARDNVDVPEGGGLLYHRPHDPDRPDVADRHWELDTSRPRRFHPRTLPLGLLQIVGHSGHRRCAKEMPAWMDPAMAPDRHEGLRTLIVDGDGIAYRAGAQSTGLDAAAMILTDSELNKTLAAEVPVLALDVGSVDVPRS